jgi:hypothetical protein
MECAQRYKLKQKRIIKERKEANQLLINRMIQLYPDCEITQSSQSVKIYLAGSQIGKFLNFLEKNCQNKNEALGQCISCAEPNYAQC